MWQQQCLKCCELLKLILQSLMYYFIILSAYYADAGIPHAVYHNTEQGCCGLQLGVFGKLGETCLKFWARLQKNKIKIMMKLLEVFFKYQCTFTNYISAGWQHFFLQEHKRCNWQETQYCITLNFCWDAQWYRTTSINIFLCD